MNGTDGNPAFGDLAFDYAGNIYGTTTETNGSVFELMPSQGGWIHTALYTFTGGADGSSSWSGVVFDNTGNLYSTTEVGGSDDDGVIFELAPTSGGWAEHVLHSFVMASDGENPFGGLIFDSSGSLMAPPDMEVPVAEAVRSGS
jgi:hypothetical protein